MADGLEGKTITSDNISIRQTMMPRQSLKAKLSAFLDRRSRPPGSAAPRATLPAIHVDVLKDFSTGFASPHPLMKAVARTLEGQAIGRASFAVSPLFDRVYLFEFKIDVPFRRQGYGMAFVRHIMATYPMPITTVHELNSASSFWNAVRDMASEMDGTLTGMLSIGDMDKERARWAHLRPNPAQMSLAIFERISRGETYAQAVGRGPDTQPLSSCTAHVYDAR